jgi:D-alanine-D-alanine ligase
MLIVPNGKIRVAVLRGGPSHEYETSMATGKTVLDTLRRQESKYIPLDIFISKDGEWHSSGRVVEPHVALEHADVVWNALHGRYGEDGQVQQLLTSLHVPYTGSSPAASVFAYHKDHANKIFQDNGLSVLRHKVLAKDQYNDEDLMHVFRNFMHPVRVRPLGVRAALAHVVHAFKDLDLAVRNAMAESAHVIVEEWIRGREVHAGVVEGMRNEKLYALIPQPAHFGPSAHKSIEASAKLAHHALGLRHYSSSHFVITPQGKIYIIETAAQPALNDSAFAHSLDSVGMSRDDFVEHLISLARG